MTPEAYRRCGSTEWVELAPHPGAQAGEAVFRRHLGRLTPVPGPLPLAMRGGPPLKTRRG